VSSHFLSFQHLNLILQKQISSPPPHFQLAVIPFLFPASLFCLYVHCMIENTGSSTGGCLARRRQGHCHPLDFSNHCRAWCWNNSCWESPSNVALPYCKNLTAFVVVATCWFGSRQPPVRPAWTSNQERCRNEYRVLLEIGHLGRG